MNKDNIKTEIIVKEQYLDLFDEARLEYNNKQTRDDRNEMYPMSRTK